MECEKPTLLKTAPEKRIHQLKEQLKLERKKLMVASIIDALKTYDPDYYSGIRQSPHVKFASEDFTDEDFDAFVELLHQNERLKHEYKGESDTKQCILRLNNGIILELEHYEKAFRGRWWNDYAPFAVLDRGFKDSSNYLIRLAEKDDKTYFEIYDKGDYYARFRSYPRDSRVNYGNWRPLDEVLVPVSCEELKKRYEKMCQDLDASLETTGTDDVRGQDSDGEKGNHYVKVKQFSFLEDAGSNS